MGFPTFFITFAIVNVLPEPVTPTTPVPGCRQVRRLSVGVWLQVDRLSVCILIVNRILS